MTVYTGTDIKYLLEKKGYTLTAVAHEIGVSLQCVHLVVWGQSTSRRVVNHIERLLGFEPGTIKIHRATNRIKAA
jgi:hypothetical protein